MFKVFIAVACSTTTLFFCASNSIARNTELAEKHNSPSFVLNNIDTTPFPNTPIGLAKVGGPTGKITGKLLSVKTGDPIVGASITLKSGAISRTVKSDYNGVYTVSELPEGIYSISISHITFGNKLIEDVKIIKKDVVTQDITMQEFKGKNLDEVVVTGKSSGRVKESVASLLIQQKNAASVSDGISAEAIRRTPDKTTSDIMKRVSGASIQDDKFVVIRGLNDRYNAAFINGAPLPSSESDRKAFSFDVFPANMLDNLVIVKTATPDVNGEFAGGVIFINTKDIPTKNFQSVSLGLGYNTVTTFKENKYEQRGKWDWLGIDDGTKKLSSDIPSDDISKSTYSNADKARFGTLIKNNWKAIDGKAPLNINFQYSNGLNIQRHQKDFLGVLFSATYSKTENFTDGERKSFNGLNQDDKYVATYSEKTNSTQVLAGLMGNVSLKLNENNKFSFKNLYSINSDYRVISRNGYNDISDPVSVAVTKALWYTSNKILSSQLSGEHFWKQPKIKVNWTGGYTSIKRDIPSLRRTSSYYDPEDPTNVHQDVSGPYDITYETMGSIFSSYTTEKIKSFGADLLRKFKIDNYNSVQIKSGVYYQKRDRDFGARYLRMCTQVSPYSSNFDKSLLSLSDDSVFRAENFGKLANGKYGFGLSENPLEDNKYSANSTLSAYYLMLDARILKFIRINGGIRSEKFNQILNSASDSVNTTIVDNLPSANLIISLNSKQNLRFSYSQTLNRPEYRELAPFIFYDYVTKLSINGNTKLERVKIDNYDFRYEFYPSGGQLISFSYFYKNIPNPIEFVITPNSDAKFINAVDGKISGLEFELRANIGSTFKASSSSFLSSTTVFGNAAFIHSEVSFGADSLSYGGTRAMQGQSPYIYNAGITYQDKKGYSGTIQANYSAPRIFIGGGTDNAALVENGRTVVDFQLAKTFEKRNIELKLNVKDILAKQFLRFYDLDNDGKYDENKDKIFSYAKPGSVISASVTYKF